VDFWHEQLHLLTIFFSVVNPLVVCGYLYARAKRYVEGVRHSCVYVSKSKVSKAPKQNSQ